MAMMAMNQSSPSMPASLGVPQTQNTAPVIEFRCLYTSDLRRKQKRWQDGRLKFHTFNKRVMVYDDRSNFVGDTHWRKDYEFEEGQEVELERGGIMVEVSECIGKRDQDLTELVDKRVKDREDREAAKKTATPMRPRPSLSAPHTPAGSALLRPKSLNAVLGNPTGHYGKAVIPDQSPFEQRHQAIRDENGRERPAKRRKQVSSPPSKHGYAQNLTGTQLVLSSLRPPSTASIRYEPLKSTFQQPSAKMIDTTEDEEVQRIDDGSQILIPKKDRAIQKVQRSRSKKSPARNGYASNLTGASLSLNRPETISTKRSHSGLVVETNGFRNTASNKRSSSSVEPDSFKEDEPVKETARKIQRQKEPAVKVARPRSSVREVNQPVEDESSAERPARKVKKPPAAAKRGRLLQTPALEIHPLSSSPPVGSRAVTELKSAALSDRALNQSSSATALLAGKPTSTLRIKSRPPRKMMFMERSLSRSSANTESSGKSISDLRKQKHPKAAGTPVLSQATMRLDAFGVQQQQQMEERLIRHRYEADLEDVSSSPVDSGIDHHKIDHFLSRRTSIVEKIDPIRSRESSQLRLSARLCKNTKDNEAEPDLTRNSGLSRLSQGQVANRDLEATSSANTIHNGPEDPYNQALESPPRPNIKKVQSHAAIPSTNTIEDTTISRNGSKESPLSRNSGSCNVSTPQKDDLHQPKLANEGEKNNPDEARPQDHQRPWNSRESTGICFIGPTVSESLGANSPAAPVHDLDVHSSKELPIPQAANPQTETSGVTISETTQVALPMGSTVISANAHLRSMIASSDSPLGQGIQSATPRFRAMLKSSASPPSPGFQDLPVAQFAVPQTSVSDIQKAEAASSDVAIKASPGTSVFAANQPDSEVSVVQIGRSKGIIEPTAVAAVPDIPVSNPIQPKPRLVNPATRGPSIQATAFRTVNALDPAFNALPPNMAPPLTRVSKRPDFPAQEEALRNQGRGPVKEVTASGPWSRESFDIFGAWRPPVPIDKKTVNG